jgi:Tfp pilus assembly ATPase PilU
MQTAGKDGMITLDDALVRLYAHDMISGDTCLERCVDYKTVHSQVMGITPNPSGGQNAGRSGEY